MKRDGARLSCGDVEAERQDGPSSTRAAAQAFRRSARTPEHDSRAFWSPECTLAEIGKDSPREGPRSLVGIEEAPSEGAVAEARSGWEGPCIPALAARMALRAQLTASPRAGTKLHLKHMVAPF